MRFSHPGVQLIDFSPCERYVSIIPLVETKNNQLETVPNFPFIGDLSGENIPWGISFFTYSRAKLCVIRENDLRCRFYDSTPRVKYKSVV